MYLTLFLAPYCLTVASFSFLFLCIHNVFVYVCVVAMHTVVLTHVLHNIYLTSTVSIAIIIHSYTSRYYLPVLQLLIILFYNWSSNCTIVSLQHTDDIVTMSSEDWKIVVGKGRHNS